MVRVTEEHFDGLGGSLGGVERDIPGAQWSVERLLKYHCDDYVFCVVVPVGIGFQRLAFIEGLAAVHEADTSVGMYLRTWSVLGWDPTGDNSLQP